jgi:hypothetical protein
MILKNIERRRKLVVSLEEWKNMLVKEKQMTEVTTITCPICGYTVFSRARHDFRSCNCGKVYIDGGFDYVKLGYNPELGNIKTKQKKIPQTPMELYEDWNTGADLYGLIPPIFKKESN